MLLDRVLVGQRRHLVGLRVVHEHVLDRAELEVRHVVEFERLRSPEPVQAQGMALVERILTNADGSPLYNASEPGALHDEMRGAAAALEADAPQSHLVPIVA